MGAYTFAVAYFLVLDAMGLRESRPALFAGASAAAVAVDAVALLRSAQVAPH